MTKKEQALNIFLCAVCLCAVAFAVLRPKVAAEAASAALSLCATRVVPSLFLFMAAAKMLAKCGFASLFSRVTHGALECVFRISACGAAVLVLGVLSGYPAGAVAAGEFLSEGKMERAEAERILPFATAASPAFLVGAVGGMFGGHMGAVLLAGQTVSALTLLFITRRKSFASLAIPAPHTRVRVLSALASSIKESGLATLSVCSFITFFSVFSAMFRHVFSLAGMSAAVFTGVLEISGGFSCLAGLGENYFACGLILGFGGFSVFMQTAEALGDTGVRMGRYLLCKCVQAILCGALCALIGKLSCGAESLFCVLLFGREQGKIEVLWQGMLSFVAIFVFCALVLAIFLKILRFFLKK